jgi:hypothetical protein
MIQRHAGGAYIASQMAMQSRLLSFMPVFVRIGAPNLMRSRMRH